jgi:hypothetical protein
VAGFAEASHLRGLRHRGGSRASSDQARNQCSDRIIIGARDTGTDDRIDLMRGDHRGPADVDRRREQTGAHGVIRATAAEAGTAAGGDKSLQAEGVRHCVLHRCVPRCGGGRWTYDQALLK